jgi:hypothetical protein
MSGVASPALRAIQLRAAPILPRAWKLRLSRGLGELTSARMQRRLARLVRRPGPIVAGPWLGEVGFELLYWIPFLAWFAERYDVPRERLVVMSRGGTRAWYAHLATRYYDVFDQIDVDRFRTRNERRSTELGEQKQIAMTAFDRELLAPVLSAVGGDETRVLHPSTMFGLFRPFWWGHLDSGWVRRYARFHRLTAPPADILARLPRDYVAVKFYYNEAFPPTARNRTFARDVLYALRAQGPVVSLSTGLALDDHEGWEEEESLAAHGIQGNMSPATNLALQTTIVAGARAWVGTYGGFAYLAPFHGVRATAYYAVEGGFSARHLALAGEAFGQLFPESLLSVRQTPSPLTDAASPEPSS